MPVEIYKANENLYILYWLGYKPFFDSVDSFFFHLDFIYKNNKD